MESLILQDRQIYSVKNSRRVLKSLKKVTDLKHQNFLLGSDSMYSSSIMDGKFKLFSVPNLIQSVKKELIQSHYVESQNCINDCEYFQLDNEKELIVAGMDDGSFHVYDYSLKKGESYERPIFKINKEKPSSAVELESTNTIFKESMFEHSDSIVAIEKHFRDKKRFLTAGKDSLVNIWTFQGEDNLVEFQYEITKDMLKQESLIQIGSVTKAKWLEEEVVAMSLTDGTVQIKDLRTKQDEKPSLLTSKGDCAVWDLALWKAQSGVQVIIAEDSGKVKMIDPRNNQQSIVLTEGLRESAMTLSVDHINQTQESLLSIGFQQSIAVLDLNNPQQFKLGNTKTQDNVSCIKSIYDTTQQKVITIFGSYDGKINFMYL